MASQCVLTKKAFVQQSVHLHTYSKSAIKSVTACIDKLLCESDCHARPFNSPPPDPVWWSRQSITVHVAELLNLILIMARCGKRKESGKERIQVACLKSLDI